MSTTKSRINISLPDDARDALAKAARRDQMPEATKAARLLEIALEIEEDTYWEAIVSQRDAQKTRYIPHDKAWQ